MAVQTPFFGKRDNDTFPARTPATGIASTGSSFASSQAAGHSTNLAPAVAQPSQGGSKLIVGPNIKLKGVEITDCDTLVVEGTVEATMDSRVIEIAEQGAFHGTAEIDVAEIRGVFDGTLVVRQKLVIYGSGKVSGKIRYGKVVIEEGGELTGQIEAGAPVLSTPSVQALGSRAEASAGSTSVSGAAASSTSLASTGPVRSVLGGVQA